MNQFFHLILQLLLLMEWQVRLFYLIHFIEQDKSAETYKIVLDTIMKIENHWLENEVVLQQIITNFVVIAEFRKEDHLLIIV